MIKNSLSLRSAFSVDTRHFKAGEVRRREYALGIQGESQPPNPLSADNLAEGKTQIKSFLVSYTWSSKYFKLGIIEKKQT